MTVCRFIDTVNGIPLVVKGGPQFVKTLRCSGCGFGPAGKRAVVTAKHAFW